MQIKQTQCLPRSNSDVNTSPNKQVKVHQRAEGLRVLCEGTGCCGSLMGLGEDFVRGRIEEEDRRLGRMTDISEQTRFRKQWGDGGRTARGSWGQLWGIKKRQGESGA